MHESSRRIRRDYDARGENFTGLLYIAVSQWVELALAALIFDQVLERLPKLKVGVRPARDCSYSENFVDLMGAALGAT